MIHGWEEYSFRITAPTKTYSIVKQKTVYFIYYVSELVKTYYTHLYMFSEAEFYSLAKLAESRAFIGSTFLIVV